MPIDPTSPWLEIRRNIPPELSRQFNTIHPQHCWLPIEMHNGLPYFPEVIPTLHPTLHAHLYLLQLFRGLVPEYPIRVVPCPESPICCNPYHLNAIIDLPPALPPLGQPHFEFPDMPNPRAKRGRGRPRKTLDYDPYVIPAHER